MCMPRTPRVDWPEVSLGRAGHKMSIPQLLASGRFDEEVVSECLLVIDFCVVRSMSAHSPWRAAKHQCCFVPIHFLQALSSVTSPLMAV